VKKYVFIVLLFLTSCSKPKEQIDQPPQALINLVESTHIIRMLISQNKIGDVLQEHDEQGLELLLDNVSPAHMAFEAEVLTTTIENVVVYYFKHNAYEQEFIKQLHALAQKYDDQVKFVIIDIDALFVLAHDAEIETTPTIFLMKNKVVIDHIEGPTSIELLDDRIKKMP